MEIQGYCGRGYESNWVHGERIIEADERRSGDGKKDLGEVSSVNGRWLDFETQVSL